MDYQHNIESKYQRLGFIIVQTLRCLLYLYKRFLSNNVSVKRQCETTTHHHHYLLLVDRDVLAVDYEAGVIMADLTMITAMCGIIFEHVGLESNMTVLKGRGLKRGLDFLLFLIIIKLNLTTILYVFIPVLDLRQMSNNLFFCSTTLGAFFISH